MYGPRGRGSGTCVTGTHISSVYPSTCPSSRLPGDTRTHIRLEGQAVGLPRAGYWRLRSEGGYPRAIASVPPRMCREHSSPKARLNLQRLVQPPGALNC